MRHLQLYGAGSATANAAAQITIPSASRLKSVIVSVYVDSITDNAFLRLELSKSPVSQIAVNNAQDAFLDIAYAGNFLTSGLAQYGINQQFDVDEEFRQGDILYLHSFVSGTLAYTFNGLLWLTK